MSEIKTYRCTMQRLNFTTEPPMKMSIDVIFQSDKEFEDGNPYHDPVAEDLTKACQSEFYKPFFDVPYKLAVDGYGGWSSTLTGGRIEEIVDKYNLDLGTPGEGKPQIAELFDHNGSSYRVKGFYKPFPDENGEPIIRDGKVRLMGCARDEATYISGYGVGGCIVPIEEVVIKGVANWDARTIVKARAHHQEKYSDDKMKEYHLYHPLWKRL